MFYRLFSPLKIGLTTIAIAMLGLGGQFLNDYSTAAIILFSLAGGTGISVVFIHALDVEQHDQTRDTLAAFIDSGTGLFAESMTVTGVPDWTKRFIAWRDEIEWMSANLSVADSIRFRNILGEGSLLDYNRGAGTDHNDLLNQLYDFLFFLGTLFDRHQSKTF